ncbi:MAG: trypsin-like peptidase domain-containing protein [Parcubacteria group bacterium]|nr:trypsin-like peptidase domain-containing protein [Parcubacteria group bacterium]
MKEYSLKEVILIAFTVSFITAFAVSSPLGSSITSNAAVYDFLQKTPFLNWFYPEKVQLPNLNQSVVYVPIGYEAQVINAVKIASPAVVSIVITKNVPIIEQYYSSPFGDDPFFKQFFGDIQIPQFRQKGFQKQEVGGGSGFIISGDGMILTNRHVVADTQAEYTVFTNDGQKYSAKVLARDSINDIAVIKIETSNLPTVKLGDSDAVLVGQAAIAIGNALGEFRNTVSVGVVSGLARSVTATGGGSTETIYDVIQTDASINPGNSGGPLLNLKGEVIGVNTAMVSGAQSIGFAIPINQIKRIVNDIRVFGKIKTPYIGVRYITITTALKESKKLPFDYGALIAKGDKGESGVIAGSPADKIGLKEGDIILELGGYKIDRDHPLISRINLLSVGGKIKIKVWQDGEIKVIEIILAEKP